MVISFLVIIAEEVKASHSASEQNAQKLNTELQEQKRRVREQRSKMINTESNNKSYKDMLSKVSSTLKDLTDNVQHTMKNATSIDGETSQFNGN